MTHLKSKIPHTHFGDQTSHNVGPTYTLLTSKIPHTHIWDQRSHIHIFEIIDPIYTLRRSKIPHTHFGDQRSHIHTSEIKDPTYTLLDIKDPTYSHIHTSEIKDPTYSLRRSKIPHTHFGDQRFHMLLPDIKGEGKVSFALLELGEEEEHGEDGHDHWGGKSDPWTGQETT